MKEEQARLDQIYEFILTKKCFPTKCILGFIYTNLNEYLGYDDDDDDDDDRKEKNESRIIISINYS